MDRLYDLGRPLVWDAGRVLLVALVWAISRSPAEDRRGRPPWSRLWAGLICLAVAIRSPTKPACDPKHALAWRSLSVNYPTRLTW